MTLGIAAEVCTDGSVRGSVRGIWYRTEVNLGTRYIPKYRTEPCGVCTENRGVGPSVPRYQPCIMFSLTYCALRTQWLAEGRGRWYT
jgi:hypothetical protein